MATTFLLKPSGATDDPDLLDDVDFVEFETLGDSLIWHRGNPSLLRAQARMWPDNDPQFRCVNAASVGDDGVERLVRVLEHVDSTPFERFINWLIFTSGALIGGRWFEVVFRNVQSAGQGEPVFHERDDLGPQRPKKNHFKDRMGVHQSWYRAHVLRAPYGTGPKKNETRRLGNMITQADGKAGLNFTSDVAFQVAMARLEARAGLVERYRLLHDMLSSQPLCFSLFAPLLCDLGVATQFWRDVVGPWTTHEDGEGSWHIAEPWSVDEVTGGSIEFAPEPAQEYLADKTAFDAYFEYRARDGSPSFIGVEVKLTEPFSSGARDKPEYRRWMVGPRSPWRPGVEDEVQHSPWNQLWRDHLLVMAHRDHPTRGHGHGVLVLLRHPADQHCARVAAEYRALLEDSDTTFIDLTLDQAVAHLHSALYPSIGTRWIDEIHRRYLDLDASEEAWVAWRRGS
jgi:hypothetical protein